MYAISINKNFNVMFTSFGNLCTVEPKSKKCFTTRGCIRRKYYSLWINPGYFLTSGGRKHGGEFKIISGAEFHA